MPAAMPCKMSGRKNKETCRTPDARKTKYSCIVAGEPTRKRLEGTIHKDHEDHISRLPVCAGQITHAVSAYTQVKMEDAQTFLKSPKSECADTWIRLPRQMAHIMVQYGRPSRSS